MNGIKLRKFEDQDLAMFKQWLCKSYVAEWYKHPDHWISEIEQRNNSFNWVHHFIAEVDGVSIGFCQYYDYALGGETWHNKANVEGAYSIDYLIGEETYLKKHYGTKFILALVDEIKTNTQAKKIIVQPEPENDASRNTLLSAGFNYDQLNDVYFMNLKKIES